LLSVLCALYFAGVRSVVGEETSFEVTSGESVRAIASELKDNNIVGSADLFILMVDGFGGRASAGIYDIPAGTSTWRIARMIARGDVASTSVTIPEGLTVKQIVALLNANPFLRGEIKCKTNDSPLGGSPNRESDLGGGTNNNSIVPPPARANALAGSPQGGSSSDCPRDGDLFPDTYKVSKGTKRAEVMAIMQKKMNDIQNGWVASGRPRPYPLKDWNDIITLASIVQRETPIAKEMPMVASVYLNRLRKNMKLQADPTVVYIITNRLGDMDGQPLLANSLTATISPYNTYINYGLPPAPIANVGRDAIRAVLNPADTNYYFFVADGTGGHAFARNLDEHNANRAKWKEIKKALKR
ncbi:MAG: endolytic transglycosylase MltG, partial [Proteobacteria bacterium]|nr:endolytic transglycosylase MltG [Pseudomonadota bacterium]